MRPLVALLALLALTAATAPGISASTGDPKVDQHGPRNQLPDAELPGTPKERVAALLREALQGSQTKETWERLSGSLDDLNTSGSLEDGGLAEAIRVADSVALATQPGLEPGITEVKEASGVPALLWRSLTRAASAVVETFSGERGTFLGLLLASLLAFVLLATRIYDVQPDRTGGPTRTGRARGPKARGPKGRAMDPRTVAVNLWESGLPRNEISRRTGIAQDALEVLVTLRRMDYNPSSAAPAPSGAWGPNPGGMWNSVTSSQATGKVLEHGS